MTDALDVLREQLAMSPREREYLDFPVSTLDEAGRAKARALLMHAALSGDPRAPAALGHVEPPDALRPTLHELLRNAPVRVRVEAGFALRQLECTVFQNAVSDAIRDGLFDSHGLKRAIGLLLAEGGEPQIMASVGATANEKVRSALIDGLWNHRGLQLFPTVWWSGLGLLRRRLAQPSRTLRDPVLPRFMRLLGSTPVVEGYAAHTSEPIPEPLKSAMADIRKGQGPVSDDLITAFPPDSELREALLVFAVEQVFDGTSARALEYVVALSGAAHRDVMEWAARHPLRTLAQAGQAALALFDAPPA